jgi:lysozyme
MSDSTTPILHPASELKASRDCFNLIKRSEDEPGFLVGACTKLVAFKPLPSDPWTIGWGHTSGVVGGMTITAQVADALLLEDVLVVEQQLRPLLGSVQLTQGQWDALVDLAYNVGARRLPMIAPKLWAYMRDGKRELAAGQLLDIDRAGGVECGGLKRRRQDEAALFMA